jgi:hypothetical protein
MFNFRPITDVPGFSVGQTEDTPGFAVDPDGLVPPYDPGAPIGVGSSPAGTPLQAPPVLQPAAAGDLRCEGFSGGCQSGGDWGTTAAYRVEGRNLCPKCAVKQLGYQDETSSTLPRLLEPWSLGGK